MRKKIAIIGIITLTFIFAMSYKNKENNPNTHKYDTSHLTPMQKHVTQEGGTEQPFNNEYWNNKEEGIYVDVVTGQPLFSSKDKYDSGSGWPSFTKPIEDNVIVEKQDHSLGMKRIEIKSLDSNSHLGHVFNDGPKEHGGSRYCTNSASLKFIPKKDLEKEGYGKYMNLFEETPKQYAKAVLSGGCFWGMEAMFSELSGVVDVVNGYTGGFSSNPSYETIGSNGHAEAVEITFNPKIISYEKLLKFFFKIHNPTTLNRQQNDIGTQYRSAIFYMDNFQKNVAYNVIKLANASGVFPGDIVTTVNKLDKFYQAEEYHQDYLQKHPNGYTCHRVREEWVF